MTIILLSLYQVTFAGGLPSVPLHSHVKLSPCVNVVELGQLTEIFGVSKNYFIEIIIDKIIIEISNAKAKTYLDIFIRKIIDHYYLIPDSVR